MAKKDDTADAPEEPVVEAPHGWTVVGEDGRRIARGQSKTAADDLAHRVRVATGEEVKVEPTEDPDARNARARVRERPPSPEPA